MDIHERIRAYVPFSLSPICVHLDELEGEKPHIFSYHQYRKQPYPLFNTTYYHDMTRYVRPYPDLYDTKFLFYPHDRVEPFPFPIFVKSRPIHQPEMSILLNLNFGRHYQAVFETKENDRPFSQKKGVLVWRGGCTGYGFGNNIPYRPVSRETLVNTYQNDRSPLLDIGLSSFDRKKYSDFTRFEKPALTLREQLRYKYILSVEGNDVATNLKWVLKSNSVPFCPPFYIQSWILEDRLVPYHHYIPVNASFNDLEEKVEWAENHPDLCIQIINNGKKYMDEFLDLEKEERIRKHLFFLYASNVSVF